ncbi:MAG: hypothetical protein QOI10_2556 [Solirubrobacterales bacterium]|jgi:hypothetical protein|nr:hypothetical protein [Solirubrobacterales bacterium]
MISKARSVLSASGLALVAWAVLAVAVSSAAGAPSVHLPHSGAYSGLTDDPREITVSVSGESIEFVAFAFNCGEGVGHASVQDIELTKSKRGYKFRLDAHANVTYSDDAYFPDENAAIALSGRFTRSGKRVSGRLHVEAPRCETGPLAWRARRR